MVEISWDAALICKSELMISNMIQIKVGYLCFYDVCYFLVLPGWYKLVFHVQLVFTCNVMVVLIQGNKWMDVQIENIHTL